MIRRRRIINMKNPFKKKEEVFVDNKPMNAVDNNTKVESKKEDVKLEQPPQQIAIGDYNQFEYRVLAILETIAINISEQNRLVAETAKGIENVREQLKEMSK